jgi:hypothetical protein
MSMQYAQPLICDARILINSSTVRSIPLASTSFCRFSIAAPGRSLR